ncbi:MAG: formate/nitrite transporter family protein [Elainellaceae cyanobacterium]
MKQYRGKKRPPEFSSQSELDLSNREEQDVIQHIRPNATIIHEVIRLEGESELRRSTSALAWSGLAAGLSMGFSLVGRGLLEASLPEQPWQSIVTSFGYSLGFLIVVMGRQQLFTETTLTAILPLLCHPNRRTWMRVLRLWAVVLLSNLLGALIFAWLIGNIDVFSPEAQSAFTHVGRRAIEGDFWTTLVGGMFAGWLIALMVWLLPGAETARIWVIIIITASIGLGELSHSIAGSVEALYVVLTGTASWGAYFGQFLIPALLGNILGGVSLVALLNHAQVAPDQD